jgi:hypothetical protein
MIGSSMESIYIIFGDIDYAELYEKFEVVIIVKANDSYVD